MAASATFALKVGVWFRRGRLFMVSPDSLGTACPLSGRNSTYRPVQIFETSSFRHLETSQVLQRFYRVVVNKINVSRVPAGKHEPIHLEGREGTVRRKSRWQTTHTAQRHGSAYRSRSA